MLAEPKCWTRNCKHFTGVIQPDGTEQTETNACKAFPKGIPTEITYGNNKHTAPIVNQGNTIVFEKKEE
jgi:hypothetical protein